MPSSAAKRSVVVVLAVAGLALAGAVSAQAAKKWIAGSIERSTVLNCQSVALGAPREEVGAVANAEFRADKKKLPRVGQAFYVRTQPAAVGRPCANQAVGIEAVLPPGVRTAITRRRRIRCFYLDIDSQKKTRVTRKQGCPRKTGKGVYGRSLNRKGSKGPAWDLPYGKELSIEVPLVSSRRLKGLPAPSCSRKEGDPPCHRGDLGPNVEFAVHVLDGNASPYLSPHAPLFVRRKAR
jgi:hypothetical protein